MEHTFILGTVNQMSVIHFMMSYDDSTYLVIEIMTYDVSIKMKAKMCESLKKIVHCQYKSMNYHRN